MLFNPHFLQWLEKKGYEAEARFVRVVLNWHRANDERGLTELKRSQYNYEFLNFILEEMIPWSKDKYDFSLMEVNRYVGLNTGLIYVYCTTICLLFTDQWTKFVDSQDKLSLVY